MFKSPLRFLIATVICLLSPILLIGAERNVVEVTAPQTKDINVLLLGRDTESGLYDVIMLLAYSNGDAKVLQIPRDTYVNLGKDSYKKINGAHRVLLGEGELCGKLSSAFDIEIDGYVSFDTELVKKAVDAVGGITVDVPADMDYDDPYQDLSIHIKKGTKTLDGKEAVDFLRFRSGYLRADIGRMDAQKIFMSAFVKKVLSLDKISVKLMGIAARHVRTDLNLVTLYELFEEVKENEDLSVSFATLPGEEVRSKLSGAWFYVLSKSGCVRLLGNENFDSEGIFVDPYREEFLNIYNSDIKPQIYSADEIDKDGIEIKERK